MALSYTGSGNNTASSSWGVSHPTASTGDLLIFHVGWDDSTTTTGLTAPSGPNGETAVVIEDVRVSSNTSVRGKIVYYVATGSWSASTLTFTPSASEQWSAVVIKVPAGEFDANTPIGADNYFESTTTDSTPDLPSLTAGSTDGGGTVVGFMVGDTDDADGTITGWTSRASTDRGAVGVDLWTRDTTATNGESISAATGATYPSARDYVSFIYIIRVPVAPTVTTQAVSSISYTTATGNGNVTSDGGATITERGVCWNTSTNPTTSNSKATSAGTTGSFTASMTGLTASTHYYARAYAINSVGTSYGTNVEFDTLNNPPTITQNTADATNFGSDTTPTLEFTGTDANADSIRYQIQIATGTGFGTIDTYALANVDGGGTIPFNGDEIGQSFTGDGSVIGSVTVQLNKSIFSASGDIYIKIYAHSGTYGTSSVGTGSYLAISDAVNTSSFSTGNQDVVFPFSGANQITLSNGTHYVLTVDYDGVNDLLVRRDTSSPSHSGNHAVLDSGVWTASTAYDLGFIVTPTGTVLDKLSGTDSGFANTTDGGDTDPFDSGDLASFTVQAGDALATDTYYWRVRALDPAGSNTWSDWSATRSFTVSSGAATNSERGAKVRGQDVSNAERSAKIKGQDTSTAERAAKITGVLGANAERSAKIYGQDIVNAERNAKVRGFLVTNDERDAKIRGQDSATTERPSKIHGVDTSSNERDAKIRGALASNAERDAKIHGIDSVNNERSAKVRGSIDVNDSRDAKIYGVDTINNERAAKIRGFLTDSSERSSKIRGQESSNNERQAKIYGQVISTDDRNAKIHGIDTTSNERDAKIRGSLSSDSERAAKVTGIEASSSERDAKIHGIDTTSSERNSKIRGKDVINDERSAKIRGQNISNDEKDAKVHGQDTANNERAAKIYGTGGDIITNERSAKITGAQLIPFNVDLIFVNGKPAKRITNNHYILI